MSLEEAKGQCRIDLDFTEDDGNLARYIRAARELAEVNTRRTFCATRYVLSLNEFPAFYAFGSDEQRITFPTAPIIEIVSLSYLDMNRARVVIDLSDELALQTGLDDEPPWILPPALQFWPASYRTQGSISVEFLAGYPGTAGSPLSADGVPARAKQAMLMLVGHWYENREDVVVETRQVPVKIQRGFDELLDGLILRL